MGPPGGPIFGPCLGSFFEVFCIRVAEAQSFGFNETLWLMATGRATVPNLYADCLSKPSCNVFVCCKGRPLLWILRFCGLIFGPKNGTVKVLFFCSFTKLRMRSQKWDRQAVPFLGPCLGSFFEVFVSGLQKRKVLFQ